VNPPRLLAVNGPSHTPAGAVYVGHGSPYANPYPAHLGAPQAPQDAFRRFAGWLAGDGPGVIMVRDSVVCDRRRLLEHLPDLAGLDLACTCPLPTDGGRDWCHRSALLWIANQTLRGDLPEPAAALAHSVPPLLIAAALADAYTARQTHPDAGLTHQRT